MTDVAPTATLTIDAKGQLTIPTAWRDALGLTPGDTVVLSVEEGAVVARTRTEFGRWFRQQFAGVGPDDTVDDAERETAALEARLTQPGDPSVTARGSQTLRALGIIDA